MRPSRDELQEAAEIDVIVAEQLDDFDAADACELRGADVAGGGDLQDIVHCAEAARDGIEGRRFRRREVERIGCEIESFAIMNRRLTFP